MTVQCGFGARSTTRLSPLHARNSLSSLGGWVVDPYELGRRRHTLEKTIPGSDRLARRGD